MTETRHTVDTITPEAKIGYVRDAVQYWFDAAVERLDRAVQAETKAATVQRALASTIIQARRWASRARDAEANLEVAYGLVDDYKRDVQRVLWSMRAVRQVRGLHQNQGGTCGTCADESGQAATWPCPTSVAIDEHEAER